MSKSFFICTLLVTANLGLFVVSALVLKAIAVRAL